MQKKQEMKGGRDPYGTAEEEEISLRKRGEQRKCRKFKDKQRCETENRQEERIIFTRKDLLGVGGDFRYAVGGGRPRRGGGGSMGGAIRPRVRGSGGRSEDSGIEGCQDGGQYIQVLTGWWSSQRVWI